MAVFLRKDEWLLHKREREQERAREKHVVFYQMIQSYRNSYAMCIKEHKAILNHHITAAFVLFTHTHTHICIDIRVGRNTT